MRNNRSLAFIAACVLAYATTAPAYAAPISQDFLTAMGQSGGDALSDVVDVEINKGASLRLSAPAASVAIADPSIADVQVISPRMLYVNGRGVGETSIIAVDNNDNVILERTVNVTHNLSRLKRAAAELSPESDVVATSTDNAIILKGKVDSPVVAEKMQRLATSFLRGENQSIINMMDTSSSDQVMLKVRIVEVARSELKRFGINWENVLTSGDFIFGLANGRDVVDAAGGFTRSVNGDNSINVSRRGSSGSLNAVIDALESDGLVSVLAEPSLTTRSGTPASFLAGGEYPIPVPGDDGTVTIEYREFGVSLQFTPVVLTSDKISLTVLPEVSALSDENSITGGDFGTIPSLTTRRASTTVDLGSGQTFAVAGLLRSDQSSSSDAFPGLGDVPILGALFRSSEYQNQQTELVILVTPYIVKPVDDASQLATPMDGYTPPTDGERILLGRLHGETPAERTSREKAEASAPPEATGTSTAAPVAPVTTTSPSTLTAPAKPAPSALNGMGGQAGFLIR